MYAKNKLILIPTDTIGHASGFYGIAVSVGISISFKMEHVGAKGMNGISWYQYQFCILR